MTNTKEDILDKLRVALFSSCKDALYFSDDETHLIDAEYLLTVNAAKAIKSLNIEFGVPYKIYFEHSTEKLSTACTPLMIKKPADNFTGYDTILRKGKSNTTRKGKIDIAVYSEETFMYTPPICVIEVKGFNPPKGKIIEDLERNAEYFSFTSATGNSQILFTVFIALHSYKNTMTYEKEKSNLKKIELRYQNYINELNLDSSIKTKIEKFTIRRGTVPEHDDPLIMEVGLQGDEDYHFIGAIICFSK